MPGRGGGTTCLHSCLAPAVGPSQVTSSSLSPFLNMNALSAGIKDEELQL